MTSTAEQLQVEESPFKVVTAEYRSVRDSRLLVTILWQRGYVGNLSASSGAPPIPFQLYLIQCLWAELAEYIPEASKTIYCPRFYRQRLGIPALGESCAQAESAECVR